MQRNGRPSPAPQTPQTTTMEKTDAQTTSTLEARRSHSPPNNPPAPWLLLVYPVILAMGSLFSTISPIAAMALPVPVDTPEGDHTAEIDVQTLYEATNYFARKHNILNVYFVKFGWFWTTLAFVLLQITTRPASSPSRQPTHYAHAAIRYTFVTISWILTTQWFFGPALIDRSFTFSGGHCEALPAKMQDSNNMVDSAVRVTTIFSSTACKAAGGRWRGGHDISGHVFMLVLSSAFLLFELYLADAHSSHPSVSPRAAAAVAHDMTEEEKKSIGGWESEEMARVRIYVRYFVYVVVVLDFWMLMMTAIWFHTWLEKVSGLVLAAATVWVVYFLGELKPEWSRVVGGLR